MNPPVAAKPHQEYNLEVQATIDKNIGSPPLRINRALWLLSTVHEILTPHLTSFSAESRLKELLEPTLGDIVVKVKRHGIRSEGKMWFAVELDQLVLAIPAGWKPTLDEFDCHYGLHAFRFGIDILNLHSGIVLQNENQLTNEDYFAKLEEPLKHANETWNVRRPRTN
jgi:hypothetical protein